MGCKRSKHLVEGFGCFAGYRSGFEAMVGEDHHLGDGGVEFHILHVITHFFDSLMKHFQGFLTFGTFFQIALFPKEGGHATQEVVNPFYAVFSPGLGGLQRTNEHFVQPQRVGAEFLDHIVGVDYIFQRFRHFGHDLPKLISCFVVEIFPLLLGYEIGWDFGTGGSFVGKCQNHPLVVQFLKRLVGGDDAEIEQYLVPEAAVKQVEHGVLGASDV